MVTARANLHPWKSTTERHARRMDGGRMRGRQTPEGIRKHIQLMIIDKKSNQQIMDEIRLLFGYVISSRGPIDREKIRLGLENPKGRPKGAKISPYRERVREMRGQMKPSQIAAELGISRQAVYQLLKEFSDDKPKDNEEV